MDALQRLLVELMCNIYMFSIAAFQFTGFFFETDMLTSKKDNGLNHFRYETAFQKLINSPRHLEEGL